MMKSDQFAEGSAVGLGVVDFAAAADLAAGRTAGFALGSQWAGVAAVELRSSAVAGQIESQWAAAGIDLQGNLSAELEGDWVGLAQAVGMRAAVRSLEVPAEHCWLRPGMNSIASTCSS